MAFIDKINPDVPEGRLLIRNGEFILKDPDAEVSKIPLDKKWDKLLKYIKDQMYSDSEVDMMICAYGHIYRRRARRDIDKYTTTLNRLQETCYFALGHTTPSLRWMRRRAITR